MLDETMGRLAEVARLDATRGSGREPPPSSPAPPFHARIEVEGRGGALERTGLLTPYDAQVIGEDALRAGRGARLTMSLHRPSGDPWSVWIERRLARIAQRGVVVSLRYVARGPLR
jgi:hypothetical protein